MSKVGKKEQRILNRIARKKLSMVDDIKDLQEAKQDIKDINPLGGRPALYTDPEQLQTLIDEYFIEMEEKKTPLTVTGLALKLQMDRRTLLEYDKRDMFAPAIKEARQKILNYTESLLLQRDKFTPGQIFYLKNNYKDAYRDKIEIDSNITQTISLVELNRMASAIEDCEVIDSDTLDD